jgi:hypothetical protein
VKIAFIYSRSKLSGKLTRLFTGSYCYHVAWVDEVTGMMYDMHLLRRVRQWPHYSPDNVRLVESPVPVSGSYLMRRLTEDEATYGVIDYCLFAMRPLFHLFGKSTPNAGGVICSEMVYEDLRANGWEYAFKEVPSPADMERVFLGWN